MKGRQLVIGDIHGGLKALKQVLETANVTENDTLIFLGDYVDGWSDAANTIRFLIKLKSTHNCVFLMGNHDELTLNWLKTGNYKKQWLLHGGQATIDSYTNVSNNEIDLHIQFLENLEDYYLDSENRLFLHAGFTNEKGVENEIISKNFYWDRTLWEMAIAMDKNLTTESSCYPKRLKLYNEIYIGHTVLSRINETTPQQRANVWNIDTAAALKGPLTIINVATKEYWQSEPAFELYPNEKGRN
ncbi:metallophosphoesterase family protein [Lutibacter sp. TH_r2]|uniref:metallophosphoesterase family protein n=1 Tax=Lutibacter sp. TH_r2 TaxID=3082083 RepID=UPI002953EFCD|nr:metallophosphoesterase family protein [Lutibacter sp. TH_r2]MDV7186691.1 metallophosphoesterase family protein [Lutibacter sp. TH_r2]